jgi:hypothetical protein
MTLIQAEATRMGRLVADLLLLARFDAGRPLDRTPDRNFLGNRNEITRHAPLTAIWRGMRFARAAPAAPLASSKEEVFDPSVPQPAGSSPSRRQARRTRRRRADRSADSGRMRLQFSRVIRLQFRLQFVAEFGLQEVP